ncbi:MAG TPA: aldo/keto reductase, partial [Pseudonocardiaceae bacterium]
NHYSLLEREAEREVLPACRRFDVSMLPYFPLANGLLTGKYRRDRPAPADTRLAGRDTLLAAAPWDRIEALRSFADERGITMATLAIG